MIEHHSTRLFGTATSLANCHSNGTRLSAIKSPEILIMSPSIVSHLIVFIVPISLIKIWVIYKSSKIPTFTTNARFTKGYSLCSWNLFTKYKEWHLISPTCVAHRMWWVIPPSRRFVWMVEHSSKIFFLFKTCMTDSNSFKFWQWFDGRL